VACQVARRLGAVRVIVGVPVAPAATVAGLPEADEVVCVLVPHPFGAVGVHYRDFRPIPEAEVLSLLDAAY
jgi:putative phosphoribosyl transferase